MPIARIAFKSTAWAITTAQSKSARVRGTWVIVIAMVRVMHTAVAVTIVLVIVEIIALVLGISLAYLVNPDLINLYIIDVLV